MTGNILARTCLESRRVRQNSNSISHLYVAAFRVSSCDFVDHLFGGVRGTIHEITRTNTNKTPKGSSFEASFLILSLDRFDLAHAFAMAILGQFGC
jgi:hypothetical protein